MKVTQLFEETLKKFQQIFRFAIGPHTIHVQAQRDPDKQWFSTPYKLSDAELETIFYDWPATWREPISLEEVSTGPPADAPVDPVPKPRQQRNHDSNEKSAWTPTDSKAKQAFKESRTKKQHDQGAASSATPAIEA